MVFVRKDQGQFEALRDAVEAATVAPQAGQTAPTPDPLDQLRKLAELRDAGIISEDEFAATKADLMGRL
jgi:putative oligomerization/nucleic acid binding protein